MFPSQLKGVDHQISSNDRDHVSLKKYVFGLLKN